jgi:hypothetical protein
MDELMQQTILNLGGGGGGGMWDGENKRKLIVMHGKENHNHLHSITFVLWFGYWDENIL